MYIELYDVSVLGHGVGNFGLINEYMKTVQYRVVSSRLPLDIKISILNYH